MTRRATRPSKSELAGEVSPRQTFYEIEVTGKEIERRQIREIYPANLLKDLRIRLTTEFVYKKKQQMNAAACGVFVFIASQFGAYFCLDSQFFHQFANERLPRAFALLHLAARELPFKRVTAALAPLANEYPLVA